VLSRPQLSFPSKTWFFGIYWNFQQQKSLNNQYLSHSEFKSYQINPLNPAHQDLSNSTKRTFQSLWSFQLQFNLVHWRNHSIFKNFYTTSPNAMKPNRCTPSPQELFKETTNVIWSIPVQWISSVQNKTKQTNKLHSFIDRFPTY
jgi:hypothetical protein